MDYLARSKQPALSPQEIKRLQITHCQYCGKIIDGNVWECKTIVASKYYLVCDDCNITAM